jgi:hypothetical protein
MMAGQQATIVKNAELTQTLHNIFAKHVKTSALHSVAMMD